MTLRRRHPGIWYWGFIEFLYVMSTNDWIRGISLPSRIKDTNKWNWPQSSPDLFLSAEYNKEEEIISITRGVYEAYFEMSRVVNGKFWLYGGLRLFNIPTRPPSDNKCQVPNPIFLFCIFRYVIINRVSIPIQGVCKYVYIYPHIHGNV